MASAAQLGAHISAHTPHIFACAGDKHGVRNGQFKSFEEIPLIKPIRYLLQNDIVAQKFQSPGLHNSQREIRKPQNAAQTPLRLCGRDASSRSGCDWKPTQVKQNMVLIAQETSREFTGFQLEPLLKDSGIPLAVMGMLVVFAALLLICVFIICLPRLMATLDRYHPEINEDKPQAAPKSKDQLPEETLVVIAAAVAEALDQPHRIVHTRELTPEDMAWSLEGRMQHHGSHRIPRRDNR